MFVVLILSFFNKDYKFFYDYFVIIHEKAENKTFPLHSPFERAGITEELDLREKKRQTRRPAMQIDSYRFIILKRFFVVAWSADGVFTCLHCCNLGRAGCLAVDENSVDILAVARTAC